MTKTTTSRQPKSSWDSQKQRLKKNFPKLREVDLNFDEAHKDQMFTWLEGKLAMTREELENVMEKR